ncbi:carbohydrate kinase family protein [Candidatus Daviesbacteria bacterium]|nr:carbohydrate kinase family protein [Candidatus Daviesbacteria bacterium]
MILVTGSLAFDYIMDFPGSFADHIDPKKIHILNLSFLVNTLKKEKGGTAGNIAYTLALLKQRVGILSCAGNDFDDYKIFLEKNGVDTSNIKIIPNEGSAMAFITTDKNDNQITGFYPGSMNFDKDLQIENPKPDFLIIAPTSTEAMINFAKQALKLNIPYMFDPGMQLPRFSNEELNKGIKSAKILIGNDYEIGLIKSRLKLSDDDLLKIVEILIITLGAQGSIIKIRSKEFKISPAVPKEVVDPTGAGDAYRSGFITGYLNNLDLEICGQMGSLTACFAIEKYGTTNHQFSKEEFKKRFKENYGKELSLDTQELSF